MGGWRMVCRTWRQTRTLCERMPVATTAAVWLIFFIVLAIRRPGPVTTESDNLLHPVPSHVPYVPAEDPMFVSDDDQAPWESPESPAGQVAPAAAQPTAGNRAPLQVAGLTEQRAPPTAPAPASTTTATPAPKVTDPAPPSAHEVPVPAAEMPLQTPEVPAPAPQVPAPAPEVPAPAPEVPAPAPEVPAPAPEVPAPAPEVPAPVVEAQLKAAVVSSPASLKSNDVVKSETQVIMSAPGPVSYTDSHEPLSCFTNQSTADQKSFSEDEMVMFRYLYDWPETPTSKCKRMLSFGGLTSGVGCLKDGDKYACLDPPLRLASAADCLVYSFGINYDWSFDEAMERFGCEVHSFDPTIDYPEGPRSPGITFHHIGIGRNNHTNVYGWQINTLDEIVKMLGHEGRTIHYLKMDVEGSEFGMLAQQLIDGVGDFVLDKVEQIGFEIHYRLDPRLAIGFYDTAHRSVKSLKQLGFHVVQWEYNKVVWQRYMFPGVERPVSLLYEILLVKNGADTWDRSLRSRTENVKNGVETNIV